uniref:Uncharacterized protein n=1 Tax=Marmota marmota marmota TaxID=9994 RepID=A0A8C5ZSW2_MARMA
MVGTKADSVPGTYRKVVASPAPKCSLVPPPLGKKELENSSDCPPKDSEKENQILEKVGRSGLGRAKRKVCPLQPDHTDDEKNRTYLSLNNISYLLWYSRV